jgi:nucleotide-binding universal stress UspA family protein
MTTGQVPSLHTILVPLDGSERSERALPIAERLAAGFGSTLLLVQVIEPTATFRDLAGEVMLPQVYRQLAEIEDEVTHKYLNRVALEARQRGRQVKTRGLRGQPAPTLLDLAKSARVDLVVMASHGAGGVERFAFGSVADRMIRHGTVPVLLVVRPWGDERRYLNLARALVPLDGSETAEAALDMVRQLAGRLLHAVTLVRVVDPGGPAGETATARGYLQTTRERLATELAERGCTVDELVLYGRPEEQIIERSQDGYDLLVLSTHGRSGPERWLLGSVADRVLQGARIPVLLARAPKEAKGPANPVKPQASHASREPKASG